MPSFLFLLIMFNFVMLIVAASQYLSGRLVYCEVLLACFFEHVPALTLHSCADLAVLSRFWSTLLLHGSACAIQHGRSLAKPEKTRRGPYRLNEELRLHNQFQVDMVCSSFR